MDISHKPFSIIHDSYMKKKKNLEGYFSEMTKKKKNLNKKVTWDITNNSRRLNPLDLDSWNIFL